MKETACYIHIPFCDHKCIYCDFYSVITSGNINAFLNSLKLEIERTANLLSENRRLTTIYFGGGTPSLMAPGYISEIIQEIKNNFDVNRDAEITLETNPGTVNKEKLEKFKKAGINRLSIGVQSFYDDELKFLTRIHGSEDAVRTVYNAAAAGFENISIDLIFNLPKQSKEKWRRNLETAAALPVKHVSAYSLILERGTILNKMVLDGKVEMQDEDYDADLYEFTIDFLKQNNFIQYEVSNFTRQGYKSRHNCAYWNYLDYLGFGTSAHSFINGKRWWNYSSLKKYIFENEKGNAVAGSETLTKKQMHDEYIMLALRAEGINIEDYKKRFDNDWLEKKLSYFRKLEQDKLLIFNKNMIKLTGKGYTLCDEILRNIL